MRVIASARDDSALIDAFCDQVWLQDGLARSSLASYRRDLVAWADWLAHNGHSTCSRPGAVDIESFLAVQFRAEAKSTSIGRRLSSLRRFYRLQAAQGTIAADPTLRVRAPKLPRRLPKSLSEAAGRSAVGRAGHRNEARIARPGHAGDALRHRPARFRARRPQAWPR